jgi:hypothetical protein
MAALFGGRAGRRPISRASTLPRAALEIDSAAVLRTDPEPECGTRRGSDAGSALGSTGK